MKNTLDGLILSRTIPSSSLVSRLSRRFYQNVDRYWCWGLFERRDGFDAAVTLLMQSNLFVRNRCFPPSLELGLFPMGIFIDIMEEVGEAYNDRDTTSDVSLSFSPPKLSSSANEAVRWFRRETNSCAFVQQLLDARHFSVEKAQLACHWRVTFRIPKERMSMKISLDLVRRSPIPLLVCAFEDDDFLVVYKPASLSTTTHRLCPTVDVVSLLLQLRPQLQSVFKSGVVHRLDRGTSGLLCVAKTVEAFDALAFQFSPLARRVTKKTYRALSFVLDLVVEFVGCKLCPGDSSCSDVLVRILRRYSKSGVVLVECSTSSASKHQIRRTLTKIGLPILQDTRYGGAVVTTSLIHRLALHAASFSVVHPTSGQVRAFICGFPDDFVLALQELEKDS